MAEIRSRRVAGLLAGVGMFALVLAFMPAVASAQTVRHHDARHDVHVNTLHGQHFHQGKAPAVRYDDVTWVRADYRRARLVLSMHVRDRDDYSSQVYSASFVHGHKSLGALLVSNPLDPRGTLMSFSSSSKKSGCDGARHHLTRHTIRMSIPARCLGWAHAVKIAASASRENKNTYFNDDVSSFTVRRG